MARLNISLTNEMAKKIQDIAESDGKTISSLVTESVNIYMKLRETGLSKDQLLKMLKFQELTKAISAVPVPSLLLDLSINMALQASQEKTLELWAERGKVIGELLKSISPDLTELSKEIKEYSDLIPLDSVDLKVEGNNVELMLVGTGFSIGASSVTAAGMKGFLEVYGIKNLKETISEGFVKITGSI
jgi:hypothetical protein